MEFGRDGGHADLVGHAGQGLDVADYLVDRRTVDRKILMHGPTPELRVMYLLQSFRSFRGSFNHNGRPSARSKLRIAYINFCSRDGQMLSTPKYTALAPLRKDASIWPSRSTRSGRRAATRRRHGGRKCTEMIFLENTIHGMKFLSSSGLLRSRSEGRELSSPFRRDKSLEICHLVWMCNKLQSHLNRGVSVA